MATEQPRSRRHSAAVYRRRRLAVLILLLAIVATVWVLIAQPWRTDAVEPTTAAPGPTQEAASELPVPESSAPAASPQPSASASAAPTPEPTSTSGAPACTTRDLEVVALTDKTTYGSGQNPLLSIRLTNTSDVDCTVNVGTTTQSFTITSGNDTWWRSTDCQSTPSDMIALIAAGQTVESATPLEWDRTRSAVGTCTDASRPPAPAGGASYHLSVEIGGVTSSDSAQFLLY
jgi:cytoskeletal protein RodZ